MKVKIKEPLPFILQKELVDFDVVFVNGAIFIKTDKPKFKQLVKKSEYEQIIQHKMLEEEAQQKRNRSKTHASDPSTSWTKSSTAENSSRRAR